MSNRSETATAAATTARGRHPALRVGALVTLLTTWVGAPGAAPADEIVLQTGELIEGTIVDATRNTVVIRRAIGGMRQMRIRDVEEVRIDLVQGGEVSGQILNWADGVHQVRSGGEVVRIREGRILSRAPHEGASRQLPRAQPPRPQTEPTVEEAAAPTPRDAPPARELSLHSVRTGETLSAVYRENGRLLPNGLAQLDYILRDYRTGEVRPIAPGLLDLLHELKQALHYRQPIEVISGYRSPATNAMLAARSKGVSKNSYHLRGMAVDIRMPGRPLVELRDAALRLRRGGVGYYPNSGFVHVDVGPVRSW
jgi:uncharacterized protein YcbK (DUF882 family)